MSTDLLLKEAPSGWDGFRGIHRYVLPDELLYRSAGADVNRLPPTVGMIQLNNGRNLGASDAIESNESGWCVHSTSTSPLAAHGADEHGHGTN